MHDAAGPECRWTTVHARHHGATCSEVWKELLAAASLPLRAIVLGNLDQFEGL